MVKHLPAMCETWVRSPGWEDPLEKEMAAHSRTVAWKIALLFYQNLYNGMITIKFSTNTKINQ